MMRILQAVLAIFALASFLPAPAIAHPHAWIVMSATVQFNNDGLITGLYLEWRFDEDYSAMAIEGLDVNKDGFYDSEELRPLTKANIEALQEYDYFAYVKVDGKKWPYKTVTQYSEYYANGHLTMGFTLPFEKPVDPRKHKVYFKVYDPSFYIAMDFQKIDPVIADGKMPAGCKFDIRPVPSDEEIEKTRNDLAKKGKDWAPAPEDDFGAMFAQPVLIVCQGENVAK